MGKKSVQHKVAKGNPPETALALLPEREEESPFKANSAVAVVKALRDIPPGSIHKICIESNRNLAGAEFRLMFLAYDIASREEEYVAYMKEERGAEVKSVEVIRWSGIAASRFSRYVKTVEILLAARAPLHKLRGCSPDRLNSLADMVETDDQDGVISLKEFCSQSYLALLDPGQTDDNAFSAEMSKLKEKYDADKRDFEMESEQPVKVKRQRPVDRLAAQPPQAEPDEVESPVDTDDSTPPAVADSPSTEEPETLKAAIEALEHRFGVTLFEPDTLTAKFLWACNNEPRQYVLAASPDEAAQYARCDADKMEKVSHSHDILWRFLKPDQATPSGPTPRVRKLKTKWQRGRSKNT